MPNAGSNKKYIFLLTFICALMLAITALAVYYNSRYLGGYPLGRFLVGLFLVLLGWLASWFFFSYRTIGQIYRLASALNRISEGDLTASADNAGGDMSVLSAQVNLLASRLRNNAGETRKALAALNPASDTEDREKIAKALKRLTELNGEFNV